MSIPGFIFGGDTGIKTPEDLARARAVAQALLMPQRPAQNVGEGLAVLGQAIRGRREMNAANRAQATGDASASSAISQALGGGDFPAAPGGGSVPSPDGSLPSVDVSKSASGSVDPQSIYSGLKARGLNDAQAFATLGNWKQESEFRPGAINPGEGAVGFTQWREGRKNSLENFAKATGRSASDPEAQMDFYVREAGIVPDKTGTVVVDPGGSAFAKATDIQGANRALKGFIRYGSPYDQGGEGTRLANALAYQKRFGSPAVGGVAAALAGGPQGQQVASLDPSVGMPPAPSPVAAALQLPQQGPIPQARPDVAAALNGAPPPGAVGGPEAITPAGQRVLGQMMNPLPMGGSPMQMQPPQGAAPIPAPVAPQGGGPLPPLPTSQISLDPMAAAPQAATPAAPGDASLPVMAGGSSDAIAPGQGGPSVQQLMQAAQNPWLKPEQRQLVNSLLAQKMKQNDPATLLEMEKNRLDMEKTRIETERLQNPQMSPADKARLDLDTQKFQADQKKLMELSPGTTVFDPATRAPVYSAPKEDSKPAGIAEYEYAKGQGFPGTYADWEASKKGGMSLQVDPTTGEVTFQQGGNIKPMTEAQSKDTTFATRAAGALPLLDKYGDALTSFGGSLAADGGKIGNYMKSKDYQQAEQAGKEFLQAILRKDTGAAITAGETAEYGSVYLPSPGDSPELLAQKKASRTRALEAMKAGMTPQALLAQEKALAASPNAPEATPAAGGAPKAGAVEDGYRFKGGDPADKNNWEPAQ